MKVLDTFYKLHHKIKLCLCERGVRHPEENNYNWWLNVTSLRDITVMLHYVHAHLQGEHKTITKPASREYSSEREIKICV
jgi:hypothetical protein